jgi:hypothetical protein
MKKIAPMLALGITLSVLAMPLQATAKLSTGPVIEKSEGVFVEAYWQDSTGGDGNVYVYDDEIIVSQTTPLPDGTAAVITTDTNLPPGLVQVDTRLTTATLSATVPGLACTLDLAQPENGLFDCSDIEIDVQVRWTGTGKISRSSSTYISRSNNYVVHSYFDSAARAAPASGSINGTVFTASQIPLTCDQVPGSSLCSHISIHTMKTITSGGTPS